MSTRTMLRLAYPVLALFLVAAPIETFAQTCALSAFTETARQNGWLVQELTYEERANFLDHLNHDDGVATNFYPPHLWETVRKSDERIHIRIVFLDTGNCVVGNSGEIDFEELSYLLSPDVGF
jgi:hypothetical protein